MRLNPRRDDLAAVLRVMEAGRDALLAGDDDGECRLLTHNGRQRVLGSRSTSFGGTPAPTKRGRVPQTCEQVLRAQARREQLPNADPSLTPDLNAEEFHILSLERDTARVQLKVPGASGPTVEFLLLKTAHGWRIDDSDAVPSGS